MVNDMGKELHEFGIELRAGAFKIMDRVIEHDKRVSLTVKKFGLFWEQGDYSGMIPTLGCVSMPDSILGKTLSVSSFKLHRLAVAMPDDIASMEQFAFNLADMENDYANHEISEPVTYDRKTRLMICDEGYLQVVMKLHEVNSRVPTISMVMGEKGVMMSLSYDEESYPLTIMMQG
jgi:hypothetical protein